MKKLLTFVLVLAMVLSVSSVALAVSTDEALRAAITNANSGDTITLTGDVNLGTALEIDRDGVDLTLDLGTHTLYGMIKLKGGRLTIKNGTVSLPDSQPLNVYGHKDGESGTTNLTVEENAKITGAYGICLFDKRNADNSLTYEAYNAQIDIYGTIEASSSAVFVSGNIHKGDSVVNIHSGADLTGGPVGAVDGVGVAVNGNATVNIEDGAKVQGPTAVEVRAGQLDVKGGKITGTGTPYSASGNNNGTTTIGAAIAVSSYNISDLSVNISGGEFYGEKSLAEDFVNNGDLQKRIDIEVIGGEFNGPVSAENAENFIKSGTFSEKPAANLIARNKVAVGDGDGEGYVINDKQEGASIHVAPTTLDFDTADYGYSAISPKALIVTNDGNALVEVPTPTHDSYIFEIVGDDNMLDSGESIVFNVSPKAGLPVGAYNADVTVDGIIDIAPSPSADQSGAANETVPQRVSQRVSLKFTVKSISTGSGISVKYTGGNGFSTSNSAVPTGVEIDNVPVSFTGDGRNFTVSCIKPDAKWVTVRWNSTSVTSNFTPDAAAYCAPTNIPKTGDASLAAFVVMAIVAAAGAMRRK